jgi:hypothetical protein
VGKCQDGFAVDFDRATNDVSEWHRAKDRVDGEAPYGDKQVWRDEFSFSVEPWTAKSAFRKASDTITAPRWSVTGIAASDRRDVRVSSEVGLGDPCLPKPPE